MKKILMSVVMVMFLSGAAFAAPITGSNSNRPFVIGAPVGIPPNLSVQQMLDSIFPGQGLSATNDQSLSAVWSSVSPPPFGVVTPLLAFEFAGSTGNNDLQEFGFWTGYDTTGGINRHAIFNGSASPTATAVIKWNDATSGSITGGDPGVNVGSFSGIAYNFFGFYYKFSTAGELYTYDGLNANDRVSALTYKDPSGAAWAIFFDGDTGLAPGAAGYDFNDLVVKVESIKTVPEPISLILLGSGLLGLVAIRRKK